MEEGKTLTFGESCIQGEHRVRGFNVNEHYTLLSPSEGFLQCFEVPCAVYIEIGLLCRNQAPSETFFTVMFCSYFIPSFGTTLISCLFPLLLEFPLSHPSTLGWKLYISQFINSCCLLLRKCYLKANQSAVLFRK